MLSTFLIKKTDRLELALVRSRSPRAPVCSWYLGDWFLRNIHLTQRTKTFMLKKKKRVANPAHIVRLFRSISILA